jgi:integral membrane sensor domain MASE1
METLLFIIGLFLGGIIGLLILFLMGGIFREFSMGVIEEILNLRK